MFTNYNIVDSELLNNLSFHVLTPSVYKDFIENTLKSDNVINKITNILNPENTIIKHGVRNDTPGCDCEKSKSDLSQHLRDESHCAFSTVPPPIWTNGRVDAKNENIKDKVFTTPIQDDTLFWCIFIKNFGEVEYNLIGEKYKNYEIKEKIKVIEYLKANKNALKMSKITKMETEEIMGKLMSSNLTDLQSLHGVCAYYKIKVIVANRLNKTYIPYNYVEDDNESDSKTIVVYKTFSLLSTKRCRYSICSRCEVSYILDNYVKFESYDKPFNSVSMYKLSDLEIISKKLGLEGGIKRKKSEIYKLINVAVA